MAYDLDSPVRYLKGVGEKRAALYQKLGVNTVGDLINYYPRAYIDFSAPYKILSAPFDVPCAIEITVLKKTGEQRIRKGLSVFKVTVTDGTSDMLVTFFNSKYTVERLAEGGRYILYGRVSGGFTRREMSSPLVIIPEKGVCFYPIYSLTQGLSSNMIAQNVRQALEYIKDSTDDTLSESIRAAYGLCHYVYALFNIHRPSSPQALSIARRRLIFEELLTLSLSFAALRSQNRLKTGARMAQQSMESFYNLFKFTPTGAQLRAIGECTADMCLETPMNRLLQGDVGCGKTIVGAACVYFASKNGFQSAMMAPTEILAEQHFRNLSELFAESGLRVGLLTGSVTAANRRKTLEALKEGRIDLLVGTHAIIQENVEFKRLGLVITDEQHRFGVAQRLRLHQKGDNPHTLVMSATPIPRTLAFIIYGDLDISVIDEMPAGRKPVKTYLIDSHKRERAYGFIKKHLDAGRQAYIVCPLIEQGETDIGLESATEYAESLSAGIFRDYSIAVMHGRMKDSQKEKIMAAFKRGEVQLLVSTTVIEVGIDVPNAVVMLIENAERFGLSQLHQLRGRVGRGVNESYCVLVSDSSHIERLKSICRINDGFRIAEEDLRLRGPGDFFGFRQHGLPKLKIADMIDDMDMLAEARKAAQEIIKSDPLLSSPANALLRAAVDGMIMSASAG